MSDAIQVATPGEGTFACPHCHSARVRRSSPHGLAERLVRSFTAYHFYRCRDCGRRGTYRGTLPSHENRPSSRSGTPLAERDSRAARNQRQRWILAVILSAGLGACAGVYLRSL